MTESSESTNAKESEIGTATASIKDSVQIVKDEIVDEEIQALKSFKKEVDKSSIDSSLLAIIASIAENTLDE